MSAPRIVSLYDHSAVAVRPWADAGFECWCFDVLHKGRETVGCLTLERADLNPGAIGWDRLEELMLGHPGLLFAWPPCEDLAISGNRHLAGKRQADPLFQQKAAARAVLSSEVARRHGWAWVVENPIGALCRLWRRPDEIWHPHEFGGWLPPDDKHPQWPKHIAPRDAYTKKTGAWFGGGFVFPPRRPVVPETLSRVTASGRTIRGSRQFMYLGGTSQKTKAIRNLTPRGFAAAVFATNRGRWA